LLRETSAERRPSARQADKTRKEQGLIEKYGTTISNERKAFPALTAPAAAPKANKEESIAEAALLKIYIFLISPFFAHCPTVK